MNRQQHQLMKILQKIPVFEGLSLEQAQQLIRICTFQKYAAGTEVYKAGDRSEDFLVLIVGKLQILSPAGQELVELDPGVSIGEMGVFTGHLRSATVVAKTDSAGLLIGQEPLYQVMNGDHAIKATILENVLQALSTRLAEANSRVDALMKVAEQHEASERQAKEELASMQEDENDEEAGGEAAGDEAEEEGPDDDSEEGEQEEEGEGETPET